MRRGSPPCSPPFSRSSHDGNYFFPVGCTGICQGAVDVAPAPGPGSRCREPATGAVRPGQVRLFRQPAHLVHHGPHHCGLLGGDEPRALSATTPLLWLFWPMATIFIGYMI